MSTRATAAAAVVLAALAAGCGGGDDDEFAARANPVCERANTSLAALERPQSLEQLLRYVEEASDIIEQRRKDLGAIEPSSEDADEWKAYLEANDRAIAALVRVRESTVTGQGGEEAIAAFEAAEADARSRADELGLEECAAEPPPPADEQDEAATETETQTATEPATTSGAAEKSAWAAQADAICAQAQARMDALPAPADPVSAANQTSQVAGILKEEIRDLEQLEPPPRQEADVRRFLSALGRGANSLDRLVGAMTDEDEDAVDRFIAESEKAAVEAQQQADALGLTVCGRG